MLPRALAVHVIFDHIQRLEHLVHPVHGIHDYNDGVADEALLSDPVLPVYPFIQHLYFFVIGANLANKRLIPVGAGKATSSSIASPSPCTFTTVPTPHFLWSALSPGIHASLSAPDVFCRR